MPWLTTEGASHQIAEGETTVGSGPEAQWRLSAHGLAARHFAITRQGNRVVIRPCGVNSIIAINGRQSGPQGVAIKDGDTIDAGNTRFLYSVQHAVAFTAVSVSPAHLLNTRNGIAHGLAAHSSGIGRDRLNSIVVRDPTASRFHAEIRREAGGYVLYPHGSSGTFVNGRRIGAPEQLTDGDRIEIANTELRFVAGPIPAGTPTAEPVEDDEASHRPTVVDVAAVEIPDEASARPKWLRWLAIIALVVGTVALALWPRGG